MMTNAWKIKIGSEALLLKNYEILENSELSACSEMLFCCFSL